MLKAVASRTLHTVLTFLVEPKQLVDTSVALRGKVTANASGSWRAEYLWLPWRRPWVWTSPWTHLRLPWGRSVISGKSAPSSIGKSLETNSAAGSQHSLQRCGRKFHLEARMTWEVTLSSPVTLNKAPGLKTIENVGQRWKNNTWQKARRSKGEMGNDTCVIVCSCNLFWGTGKMSLNSFSVLFS